MRWWIIFIFPLFMTVADAAAMPPVAAITALANAVPSPPSPVASGITSGVSTGITPGVSAGVGDPSRVLCNFDFEERRLGNDEPLPMNWAKVEGDGLPHYVAGHLSSERHRSGDYSFQFDLDGGSLIYRYPFGHIRVQAGAHYDVRCFVQTTFLPNARARLTAYLTDVDGHAILSSVRQSELYATPPGESDWHPLAVEVTAGEAPTADSPAPDSTAADSAAAEPVAGAPAAKDLAAQQLTPAFLVIELSLLQPQLYAPTTLGDRTVFDQDIRGSAWFDDVSVSQVPLVALTTDRPGNVFRKSDAMRLHVTIEDRFTDDLSARLVLRNALGRTIYQNTGLIALDEAVSEGPGRKRLTLPLPDGLAAGWYQASLEMTSRGHALGRQRLNMIRLADDGVPQPPDDRFGVSATHLPFGAWAALPDVLPTLGAGRVKLAVWSKRGDAEADGDAAADSPNITSSGVSNGVSSGGRGGVSTDDRTANATAFDHLLEQLQQLRIEPTACLLDLPPGVAKRMKSGVGSSWAQVPENPPSTWQPSLAFLIARNADHLTQWQLGDDGSDAFVRDPRMRGVYGTVYQEFAKLIEKPDLSMPWPAWYEMTGPEPHQISLHVSPQIAPSQIPLYVKDFTGSSRPIGASRRNLSLFLEPLQRRAFGRDVQIRDFAERFAYATATSARRIDVQLPMSAQHVADQWMCQPDELLLIVRTLMTTLDGASFRGMIPIGDGVHAFLYEKDEHGIILLWAPPVHEGAGKPDGQLERLALNLGERPMSMDLWGNVKPLLQASPPGGVGSSSGGANGGGENSGEDGGVDVQVGPMPMFLIDVDPYLARLRASVAIDNPRLESTFQSHVRRIRFVNPYPQAIAGMVSIKAPPGWTLNPATFSYSLNPGETLDKPIEIDFPSNAPAGAKTLRAAITVPADRLQKINVPIAMNLGLSDVGMQTLALRDGKDVIVQQMISNYGDHPIDYNAFAICPGQARQERLVTSLAAGATTIKKYRFANVPAETVLRIRSGIREPNGPRMLNDEVTIR